MNMKSILKKLERERDKISTNRDSLRDLQDEVNALFESCEEGLTSLDNAIDQLSQLA